MAATAANALAALHAASDAAHPIGGLPRSHRSHGHEQAHKRQKRSQRATSHASWNYPSTQRHPPPYPLDDSIAHLWLFGYIFSS
jgi:hypothetical protein